MAKKSSELTLVQKFDRFTDLVATAAREFDIRIFGAVLYESQYRQIVRDLECLMDQPGKYEHDAFVSNGLLIGFSPERVPEKALERGYLIESPNAVCDRCRSSQGVVRVNYSWGVLVLCPRCGQYGVARAKEV